MNEEIQEYTCRECDGTGFIAWFMYNGPQGLGKAIIDPGNKDYPAKMLTCEACNCSKGLDFFKVIE